MELLLQSDNESLVNEWHKALTEAIHTYVRSLFYMPSLALPQSSNYSVFLYVCFVLQAWESDEAIEEDMPESPDTEKHDKEKEQRNSKKARGVCVSMWTIL